MAQELDLEKARPAIDVHEQIVEEELAKIAAEKQNTKQPAQVDA